MKLYKHDLTGKGYTEVPLSVKLYPYALMFAACISWAFMGFVFAVVIFGVR